MVQCFCYETAKWGTGKHFSWTTDNKCADANSNDGEGVEGEMLSHKKICEFLNVESVTSEYILTCGY